MLSCLSYSGTEDVGDTATAGESSLGRGLPPVMIGVGREPFTTSQQPKDDQVEDARDKGGLPQRRYSEVP